MTACTMRATSETLRTQQQRVLSKKPAALPATEKEEKKSCAALIILDRLAPELLFFPSVSRYLGTYKYCR